MMKRMSNKAMGGIPGFGGPAVGGGKKGKGKSKKKGSKSGNPMKREAEEKALRDKLAGKGSGSDKAGESGSSGRAAGCARRERWRASAQLRRRPFRSARLIRPVFLWRRVGMDVFGHPRPAPNHLPYLRSFPLAANSQRLPVH